MANKLEYVNPEGLRVDGRRANEVRRIRFKMNLFSRADGSAYYEQGNTKVLAAVYGPREISRKQQHAEQAASSGGQEHALINCQYHMASFSTSGERKQQGVRTGSRRNAEISLVIRQTFESVIMTHLFPRTQIDIFMQVLQADGGTRCACINAASLALLDAGIPMRDFVVSCAAGMIDGHMLADLNYVEDSAGGPDLPVALMPNMNKITLLQMDSKLKLESFEPVLNVAVDACRQIHKTLDAQVKQYMQGLVEKRGLFSLK